MGFVCLNDSEKSYTKFGKPRAEVSVLVGNNKVDRIKGKAVNGFRLNGRTYKAFRKGVPAPIEELLNVVPENFQRQLDPPFWITLSPGQLSKELNRIVDLEIVDKSLATINAELRKAKIQKEIYREQLQEAKKEMSDLSWFPEFEKDADRLLSLEKAYGLESLRINSAERDYKTGRKAELSIDRLTDAILEGSTALQSASDCIKLRKKIERLRTLGKKISQEQAKIKDVPDMTELKEIRNRGDKIAVSRGNIEILVEAITTRKKINDKTGEELEGLKAKLKRMKKVCPTCNRPLKNR